MEVVMKVMATSFKRTSACTVVFSAPAPAAGHCGPTLPPETPRHSPPSLAQSLMGTLFLSPGSWCTQGFVCALQSPFPQSCGSSVIKSHWPPKSNSLGGGRGWFLSPLLDSHVGKPVVSPRTFLTVLEFFWYNCSVVCGT